MAPCDYQAVVTLNDLARYPRPGEAGAVSLDEFLELPAVVALRWPAQVVEDFLYDHGRKDEFLDAYGGLNLAALEWAATVVLASRIASATTDPGGAEWLDQVDQEHQHFTLQRPMEEREAWDERGTWLRAPVMIEARLLDASCGGLQLVEGRTRVGILRGRLRSENMVADRHEVWLGRAR